MWSEPKDVHRQGQKVDQADSYPDLVSNHELLSQLIAGTLSVNWIVFKIENETEVTRY